MKLRSFKIASLVAAAAGSAASAQSLTTAFNGTTTLSGGNVGTYKDITALNAAGITIQSFDVNCNTIAGTPVQVEVWYRPGTYVGFDQSAAGWTLLGVGTALSAGTGQPTPIAVGGLHIPNGQVYGIRMNHLAGGVRYNSAATTVAVHANTDIQINLGSAQGALFTGTLNTPRGWNGTVYYTPGNTPVTGSCCLLDGSCQVLTQGACVAADGVYGGDGSPCGACPLPGACCLPDTCVVTSPSRCTALGGVYQGDGSACAPALCGNILASNGAITNEVGTGQNGADISRCSSTLNTAGSTATLDLAGPNFRLAEDFIVPAGQTWTLNSVGVMGYITAPTGSVYNFPPPSPFTGISMNIWNGVPGGAGSSIVASSAALGSTDWTGVYRIFAGGTSGTAAERPVMRISAAFAGEQLPAGTYWLDYQLTGEFAGVTTGFSSYVMDAGRIPAGSTPGNARQLTGTGWAAATYTLPFAVRGTIGGGQACYANCDNSTATPILNVQDFGCFLNAFAGGDSYANCDGSTATPVLNVQDFGCFLNAFAAGCS